MPYGFFTVCSYERLLLGRYYPEERGGEANIKGTDCCNKGGKETADKVFWIFPKNSITICKANHLYDILQRQRRINCAFINPTNCLNISVLSILLYICFQFVYYNQKQFYFLLPLLIAIKSLLCYNLVKYKLIINCTMHKEKFV